jgi:RimJ/RimL family protein N-acetyltransferase
MREASLETARLKLRPRTLSDLEANLVMDLNPQVHRYIFVHGAPDPAAHRAELTRRIRSAWPERGGLWVVEWQNEPGFLGWCGLLPLEQTGLIEIGYRYVPEAWGQGVATEAARAVLDHGFRVLGFDPIVAVAHLGNQASCRVLEKIGLRPEGLSRHYDAELAFYHLTRSQYLTADQG